MPKKNRTPSTIPHQDQAAPAPASWQRLISAALLTRAVRHIGALLVGLAVTWWQHAVDLRCRSSRRPAPRRYTTLGVSAGRAQRERGNRDTPYARTRKDRAVEADWLSLKA
jgi:hypothetical protein